MMIALLIAALLCEVVGILLLAREVNRGHDMEELTANHGFAKHMNYLYAAQDYRGVYLLNRLNEGDTPAQAQAMVQTLGQPAVNSAVNNLWGSLAGVLAQTLKKWDEKTEPAARNARRRDLKLGTLLILLGAGLAFARELLPEPVATVTQYINNEESSGWLQLLASPAFPSGSASFEEPIEGCPAFAEVSPRLDAWKSQIVSAWKQRKRPSPLDTLMLVGSTDRTPLSPALRRRYESNAGLARARAEAVAQLLMAATDGEAAAHRITRERVMIQIVGPAHTPQQPLPRRPADTCSDPALSADRAVRVWIPARAEERVLQASR
jgi:hypothetical protein